MKHIKIWNFPLLILAFVLIAISSCKKDDPNVAPGAVTLTAPANAATHVELNTSLSWQAAIDPNGDAIVYDVYFGTDANPPTIASTAETTYAPTLALNTTYYWKVVAKDPNGGISESVVWSFTTKLIVWSDNTHGTYTDGRDGKVYDVVKIGDQIWFAENLAYEIPGKNITDNIEWENNSAYDGWCYFDNNELTYGDTYGVLYQWEAAKSACPVGWHLPSDEEWTSLSDYLGGESEAGDKLKETGTTHWAGTNTGATNEVGFTALPGGLRNGSGTFINILLTGYWWSSTEYSSTEAYYRGLIYDINSLERDYLIKEVGFSVRCVRDN